MASEYAELLHYADVADKAGVNFVKVDPDDLRALIAAANRAEGEGWVSVKERLPENFTGEICDATEYMIFYDTIREFGIAYFRNGSFWIWDEDGEVESFCEPTHWRPLPAAPKEVRMCHKCGKYQAEECFTACEFCLGVSKLAAPKEVQS